MELISFLPLVPTGVPLLLVLVSTMYRMIRSRRRLRWLGWMLLLPLLGASVPLWPIPLLPRRSPAWSWTAPGGSELSLVLDLGSPSEPARGLLSLLLLLLGGFGCWSICRLPASDEDARGRAAGLPGLLLLLAGGQLAVQSVSPAGAALGAALVLLGILLLGLLTAARQSPIGVLESLALVVIPLAILGAAVFIDATLATTSEWWLVGCGGILLLGLVHPAIRRSPLLLTGIAQALGVTPLVAWLVVGTGLAAPARTLFFDIAAVAGPVVLGLGALNVAVSPGLRRLLSAQWATQIGMLCLTLGRPVFAPGLGHTVVVSFLMSLMIGSLAEANETEMIADLRPFPVPMRRQALAYALVAASAVGLPLTLGYALRRAVAAETNVSLITPLLLGSSTLMLAGLLQPLAALIRQAPPLRPGVPSPRKGDTAEGFLRLVRFDDGNLPEGEPSASPMTAEVLGARPNVGSAAVGMVLSLVLVLAAPYRLIWSIGEVVLRQGTGGVVALLVAQREALIAAALQIGSALLLLGLANRGLRRMRANDGALIGSEERGWALPLASLASVVAPLTPPFWAMLGYRFLRGGRSPRRALAMVVLGAGVTLLIVSWSSWWHP